MLCLGLRCFSPGSAQDLRYLSHQAWSTEDGLPQNSVHSILQTRDGYLWIATEAGLARFDGLSFQLFGHATDPAFQSDDLCCLAEDNAGALWIGSADGLLEMRQGRFRRFDKADGVPAPRISALAPRADGSVLIDTVDGAVLENAGLFRASTPMPQSDEVQGAGGDIWSYSADSVTLRRQDRIRAWHTNRELPPGRILRLSVNREGLAWIGMTNGVLILNAATGMIYPVASMAGTSVLTLFEDSEGNEWIGTESSGLHVLRRLKFRSEPALADLAVTGVTQTTDHSFWVGTREDGLRRVHGATVDTPVNTSSLTSPVILCLVSSATGGLWVGTPDGLNFIDGHNAVTRITSANGLPDDYIRSLAASPDGSVWVGTRRGLVHLRGTKAEVLTGADGLGGDLIGALSLMPPAPGLPPNAERRGNDVWAATSGGLSRIETTGTITNFSTHDGLGNSIVTALAGDHAGVLWVATQGGRLSLFDGRRFINVGDFSQSSTIVGMTPDPDGFLWLRMNRGVRRIALAALHACATRGGCHDLADASIAYGRTDGLPNDEVVAIGSSSPWLTQNGELWIPTRHGVAVTNTAQFGSNAMEPPLVLERFLLDDAPQDLHASSLALPYTHSRFTLEYAALDFNAPSEVRYRIRLEGFDKNWIEVGGRRSATYTNLPPASYLFHVQARNKDGAWSGRGVEFHFTIIPPFYRRWWFYLLVVLLVLGLLAILYDQRLRMLRRQFNAVLAERNRIAREIHDTLTQDFVATSLQLDIVSHHLTGGKVEIALQQVRQTRQMVTEGLQEARQSIWELRSNQSQESLPARLTRLVERNASIVPRLRISGPYRALSPQLEREVLRVAQEAVSNIMRHARATDASIDLLYSGDTLLLTIQDNGVGFSTGDALIGNGHYGLVGMKERARIIDAQLEIVSNAGSGTTVQLRVPLTHDTR